MSKNSGRSSDENDANEQCCTDRNWVTSWVVQRTPSLNIENRSCVVLGHSSHTGRRFRKAQPSPAVGFNHLFDVNQIKHGWDYSFTSMIYSTLMWFTHLNGKSLSQNNKSMFAQLLLEPCWMFNWCTYRENCFGLAQSGIYIVESSSVASTAVYRGRAAVQDEDEGIVLEKKTNHTLVRRERDDIVANLAPLYRYYARPMSQ